MSKLKNVGLVLLIAFLCGGTLNAQRKILNIANKQFEEKQYVSAQETYLKVLKLDYKSAEVYKKLGDSYYFNSNLAEAAIYYDELISTYPEGVSNEYLYRYAQCLRAIEEYDKADEIIKEYYQNSTSGAASYQSRNREDYLKRIDYQSGRYEINNQDINSSFTDFGSARYGDSIVFSSARDTLLIRKRIHKWTDESFLSLYSANIDAETGNLVNVKPFAQELNTNFHESTPVFTADGNTIYFTQNKIGVSKKKLDILGVYRSTKNVDGSWSEPQELSINEEGYSVAHPTLSIDESMLYFSSDKPGGFGDSDIYGVALDRNGNFGLPFNLGPQINTSGKETFPFISVDGDFYFSSNGHQGLGGLDVYYVNLDKNKEEIINVGRPINSNRDDFGFIIDPITKRGFFSSNREGGKGKDDIYSLLELEKIKSFDISTVMGSVVDSETKLPIEGTIVGIYDADDNLIDKQEILADGEYNFSSDALKNAYAIKAEKEGYLLYQHFIDKSQYGETYYNPIELERDFESSNRIGADILAINDMFNFELIVDPSHFSSDTNDLKSNSENKLSEIVALLDKYPKILVEVKSYLEDGDFSNSSQERANRVAQFLIDNGIPSSRISATGVQRNSVKLEKRLQLTMVIPMPINFDLNSGELRSEAQVGLDKVVDLMKMYPTMEMEIHGHADSRSSYWYNKRLSVDRMRAAESYLVNEGGIYWRRLRGKAYGERRLYNECSNGVPCPEEKHEINRRCEFIVKK
ncbi:OmpA family protein [Aquimarina sp. W85]|uniref:OmpA family protein n=1 Tax=Aquimarina rhodophyticola TaxID=3342246 RepID=UPI00366F683F